MVVHVGLVYPVIPAKAGNQAASGFPRIESGAGLSVIPDLIRDRHDETERLL